MYSTEIQNFINLCEWDTTRFLVFSQNIFDPFIYYSHLLPAALSLLLGIFIFAKNPKSLLARILLFITAGFAAWSFFDLILWATDKPHFTMSFWSTINLIEVFIYAGSLYFLQVFITKRDTSLRSKLIILLPLVPVILLTPTNLSLSEFDLSNCWREASEGPLTRYNYIIEIGYVVTIILYGMRAWARKGSKKEDKRRIALVTTGVVLFLLTLAWGNIVGSISDSWQVAQWGLFGMPVFVAFLSYLIVKYEEFDVRLVGAQALVTAITLLVASEFFFVTSFGNRVLVGVTLVVSLGAGMALVRSVEREIKQREELEKATKALGEANTELKKADQLKSEFLSFASHDLKSPVSKMKQWASLIHDGTITEKEQITDTLFKIKTTGDRALRLVDEFLNIRKIEEGKMEFAFEEKDIVAFTKDVVNDFQPIAKEKKLDLKFDSSAKEALTKIDTIKIRQVIENLVDNALKYTEKGSVDVSIKDEQKSVLISVKDTGPGIDPKIIPSLFAQFKRAPGETKKIKGTGLGLYIAKQIVLEHKGEVWAESEGEGKGSTFFVRLAKV